MKKLINLFLLSVSLFSLRLSAVPEFSEVKESFISSESSVLDIDGFVIQEGRTNTKERRLNWITLSEISYHLVKTAVIAEDKRFYEHSGVDWTAFASGTVKLFIGESRGASTITMQLAGLLDSSLRKLKGRRNVFEKISQMQFALELEKKWSKQEILEAYLNLLGFRGEYVGVDASSRAIFGKEAHALDIKESLLLSALIKIPSSKPERAAERACYLSRLAEYKLECSEIREFCIRTLAFYKPIRSPYSSAYHISRRIFEEGKTGKITTTLSREIQFNVSEIMKNNMNVLKKRNVKDAALLILENKTGYIKAYLGGTGKNSENPDIDCVTSRRQAGSTLKPFIYALAFDRRLLTPASVLEDKPVEIQVGGGIYSPSNYEEHFFGRVTARQALASSLNVPAVKTLDYIGTDVFADFLEKLGIRNLRESDFYGLSIALGSADVSLWDLTNAFRTLANQGIYSEASYYPGKRKEKKEILSSEAAFLVSDILADRESRALSFGLENPLSTRFPSSVKTGTSKDMRDNWCIGYSEYFTAGVWVGNINGAPMWNVSGVTGAAHIWRDVMNYLHKNTEFHDKKIPAGIVRKSVRSGKNHFFEYFIPGTETDSIDPAPEKFNGIVSPVKNMIAALDSDIPSGRQKIPFMSKKPDSRNWWRLDERKISNAGKVYYWKPAVGIHRLDLMNDKSEIIDSLRFEVR